MSSEAFIAETSISGAALAAHDSGIVGAAHTPNSATQTPNAHTAPTPPRRLHPQLHRLHPQLSLHVGHFVLPVLQTGWGTFSARRVRVSAVT